MLGPLALLWLLASSGRGGSTQPPWPGRKHPPPSRLPDRAAAPASAPSAPAAAKRKRPPQGPHAKPTAAPHVEIGPAEILHHDAAPPMPSAAVPTPIPDQEGTREPKQAARDLYNYVQKTIANKQSGLLGSKGRPNPFVRDAQRDMGLKPDGIYGPATRTRGKQLLQKSFPPRVSGADLPLYIP